MTDEELAKEEYKRRMAANDKAGLLGRRGVFPMHHRLFYQYLRWVVAEIAPSAQPSSLHWSQGEEHDRHVSYFGKQWGPHNVDSHLAELLGKQFTSIFGRKATIGDYQYVAEIISETKLNLEHLPVTMMRASTWLDEQIVQLKLVSAKVREDSEEPDAEASKIADQLPQAEKAPYSPWVPLLRGGLTLPAFYSFLEECGLLTADGQVSLLGRPDNVYKARQAPWAGTLRALIDNHLLDSNVAAICRALASPDSKFSVKISEGTLRSDTRASKPFEEVATGILKERGFLRN